MTRQRPPTRRPSANLTLDWHGQRVDVTVGFDATTGQPVDVFALAAKQGSDLQNIVADACVLISLAMQHGATPSDVAHSLGSVPALTDGGETTAPASVIGAILETLKQET